MRVLICGSRGWVDRYPIGQLLDELLEDTRKFGEDLVVIHGGARGADALAEEEARRRGIQTIVEKPDWNRYGKAAGGIRNQAMIDLHHPNEVHAFRNQGKSNGTDDMIRRARKADLPTFVHQVEYEEYQVS